MIGQGLLFFASFVGRGWDFQISGFFRDADLGNLVVSFDVGVGQELTGIWSTGLGYTEVARICFDEWVGYDFKDLGYAWEAGLGFQCKYGTAV